MIKRHLLQDEVIFQDTLECGLKVLIHPKKDYLQNVASLTVNFGGEDVEFNINNQKSTLPQGTAHFLEHMLFENNGRHLTEVFSSKGAEINAFTSRSVTAYSFNCQNDFLYLLGYLLETFIGVDFLEESITKERRIIEKELKMSDDDIEFEADNKLKNMMYSDLRASVKIGGTIGEIRKINHDILKRAFKTFYHPANMTLVLTGDFEPKIIFDFLKNHPYNQFNWPEYSPIKRSFFVSSKARHNYTKRHKNHQVNYVEVGIKIPEKLFKEINDYGKLNLYFSGLMNYYFGKTSNIYKTLKKRNLINYTFNYDTNIEVDYGYVSIATETKRPKVYIEQLHELLLDIRNTKVNKTVFSANKKRAIGNFIKTFDNIVAINDFISSSFSKDIDVNNYLQSVQGFEISDLDILKSIFTEENIYTISYLKPLK